MTGVGPKKATQILFDTAVYYATASTPFGGLADLAVMAAFDRYEQCFIKGYNAGPEQNSVRDAFTQIGFAPTVGTFGCQ